MESYKIIAPFLFLILWISSLTASEEGRILYLTKAGERQKAFQLYQEYQTKLGHHDFELLQKMALTLLEQGSRSYQPEIQLLTLFGAGVSGNERALPLIEEAVQNPNPLIQLVSINLLARYQNDHADDAICKAMSSDYIPIRFEAAYLLAKRHHPKAFGQTEALMHKVDSFCLPLIAKILVVFQDPHATKVLRKLLSNTSLETRCETILQCARADRDELLPQIRAMASQPEVHQQELCAYALGKFKDQHSTKILERLCNSNTLPIRLTALHALYQMGHKEVRQNVEEIAKNGDLFAINLLGKMSSSEPVLKELLKYNDPHIRLNAGVALLELRDPASIVALREVFSRDARDLGIKVGHSPGGTLIALKFVPSSTQVFESVPGLEQESFSVKSDLLEKTIDLPEAQFLEIAKLILDTQQNEFVALTVALMEELHSDASVKLLKIYQQKAGAPLVRTACNLALYRLKEPGPYEQQLILWIQNQWETELFHFNDIINVANRDFSTPFELTPKETSQLLIEGLESLTRNRDDKAISVLIEGIEKGKPANGYVLAGLLLNATQ